MTIIESLIADIQRRVPDVTVAVDPPGVPTGGWFIDFHRTPYVVVAEWRPGLGFGLTTRSADPMEGYGSGHDEIYRDASSAADRLVALLRDRLPTIPTPEGPMRRLRELRRVTQEDLAAALGVSQAAVSKLEQRIDMNVSSLQRWVSALGGTLHIEAEFPDRGRVRISQFDGAAKKTARRKAKTAPVRSRKSGARNRGS